MIKMASGVAARVGGPRGFMWAAMAVTAMAVPTAFWMCGAAVPLIVWLAANGGLLLFFVFICSVRCSEGHFDWEDIDHPLALWALMADWGDNDQPSWFRLILWMLMIPAEIVATLVLRPITLGIRGLLKPMPGRWDPQ